MPGHEKDPRPEDAAAGSTSLDRRMNRDRLKINWKFDRKTARRKFGYKRNLSMRSTTYAGPRELFLCGQVGKTCGGLAKPAWSADCNRRAALQAAPQRTNSRGHGTSTRAARSPCSKSALAYARVL